MPTLVRMYIWNVAIGFALSLAFVALLLWADVGGLRHLIGASDIGWIAVGMLVLFNGLVFAGVQFAIRIMMMADDGGSGGKRAPELAQKPAPVPVRQG